MDGDLRAGVAGGILAGGVVAIYTEALPATTLAVVLLVAVSAASAIRRGAVQQLGRGLAGVGLGLVVALTISPPATARAWSYIHYLRQDAGLSNSPEWGIGPRNALPWMLGLNQLFEARRQDLLGGPALTILYLAAALVIACLIAFFVLRPRRGAAGSGRPSPPSSP